MKATHIRVEVVLKNSKLQLKAGMFGRVVFTPKSAGNLIVIPRESIVGSVKDAMLYVVNNNVAKVRSVVVGKRGWNKHRNLERFTRR